MKQHINVGLQLSSEDKAKIASLEYGKQLRKINDNLFITAKNTSAGEYIEKLININTLNEIQELQVRIRRKPNTNEIEYEDDIIVLDNYVITMALVAPISPNYFTMIYDNSGKALIKVSDAYAHSAKVLHEGEKRTIFKLHVSGWTKPNYLLMDIVVIYNKQNKIIESILRNVINIIEMQNSIAVQILDDQLNLVDKVFMKY